jgi:hypothetical protein
VCLCGAFADSEQVRCECACVVRSDSEQVRCECACVVRLLTVSRCVVSVLVWCVC